jgi:Cytochrome c
MSDQAAYGANLASIGPCMACHTPIMNGKPDMTRAEAGGRELRAPGGGTIISANLTSANPEGVSKWTDTEVKSTITTGVRPDGRSLVRTMAFDWYKNITQDDLDAVVVYLRTLKAAKPLMGIFFYVVRSVNSTSVVESAGCLSRVRDAAH